MVCIYVLMVSISINDGLHSVLDLERTLKYATLIVFISINHILMFLMPNIHCKFRSCSVLSLALWISYQLRLVSSFCCKIRRCNIAARFGGIPLMDNASWTYFVQSLKHIHAYVLGTFATLDKGPLVICNRSGLRDVWCFSHQVSLYLLDNLALTCL